MILIEKTEVSGWGAAIRGMRNPMNSWDKSDSLLHPDYDEYQFGENDMKLMTNLAKSGSDHAKYRRMVIVTADITAPLYWWKEYDTYKIGTVANSCSTMHKIHSKEFEMSDFSSEHLSPMMLSLLSTTVGYLNKARTGFLMDGDKQYWWDMIQALPSSYNQKRTVMLNYEVLAGLYPSRKTHKLDEWRDFCNWISLLPEADKLIIKQEEFPKGK